MFGPTGQFRQYYDRIPTDPLTPIDESDWEDVVVADAAQAIRRIQTPPWHPHVLQAMAATAKLKAVTDPFLEDYASLDEDDALPSLWKT
jgi:hypothetical protein